MTFYCQQHDIFSNIECYIGMYGGVSLLYILGLDIYTVSQAFKSFLDRLRLSENITALNINLT
jgi:hypothetical protein